MSKMGKLWNKKAGNTELPRGPRRMIEELSMWQIVTVVVRGALCMQLGVSAGRHLRFDCRDSCMSTQGDQDNSGLPTCQQNMHSYFFWRCINFEGFTFSHSWSVDGGRLTLCDTAHRFHGTVCTSRECRSMTSGLRAVSRRKTL